MQMLEQSMKTAATADDAKLAINAQRLFSGKGFDAEKATREVRRLELATVPAVDHDPDVDALPTADVDAFLERQHRNVITTAIREVRTAHTNARRPYASTGVVFTVSQQSNGD